METSATTGCGRARPEHRLAVAAVLISAAALRLFFADARPDPSRFWDEMYGFQNVAAVLIDGRAAPAHALYPALSYLPHTVVLAVSHGLHRLTGAPVFAVVADREARTFTPTAYRLCRGVSVLFGTWSLWLLYRLGRRLFDPATAVISTLLLAAFWRHVRASAEFKPDVLVVAFVLLAIGWSLRASRGGSWRAFLATGAAIGLATAAKYNGALAALPLIAGVAVRGRGGLRLLPRLAAAGGAAIAVFALLNPWPAMVARDFHRQLDYYSRVAAGRGSDHGRVLLEVGQFFVRHHGPLLALGAAAGFLLLARIAVRDRSRRVDLAPVLAFALTYPLLYALATPLFLSQNLLPVVPLSCLFAGWTLVAAWRRLHHRVPALGSPLARRTAFVLLGLLVYRLPASAAYEETVPTTGERAAAALVHHLAPIELRLAVFERFNRPLHATDRGHRLPIQPVADLAAVDPTSLDLADAELFAAERLDGERADPYLRRLVAPAVTRVERFAPRPFVARGRELVAVFHPWRPQGPGIPLPRLAAAASDASIRLDGSAAAGVVVSIDLLIAPDRRQRRQHRPPGIARLSVNGEPLDIFVTRAVGRRPLRYHSRRWVLGEGPQELVVVLDAPLAGAATVEPVLHRWLPDSAG